MFKSQHKLTWYGLVISVVVNLIIASTGFTETVIRQVNASSDDCTSFASTSFSTTQGFCRIGHDGTFPYAYAMRFTDITVPKGATIVSAELEVRARLTESATVDFVITMESSDDAATFTTRTEYDARSQSTNSISKSQSSWEAGTWYTYDSVGPVIQEVIDRAGWLSGNDLVLFVTPVSQGADIFTQWYSYDVNSSDGAKLTIVYSVGTESGFLSRRRLMIGNVGE